MTEYMVAVSIDIVMKAPRGKKVYPVFKRLHLWIFLSFCMVLLGSFLIFQQPVWARDLTLAWDANTESNLAGYKIYYNPGASGGQILANYAGTGATEGNSPIVMPLTANESPNTGTVQFTLHGLDQATTYCFVVTAYNSENIESGSSREVFVFGSRDVSDPYNVGWGISAGDLKGFIVLYNTLTDPGVSPTLGPSEDIPSVNLPNLQAVGTPLNLQPSGTVFKQPVWVEFPCPGYSDISQLSLALYDDNLWRQVWDGPTGTLTAAGGGWLDGKPQYNASEDPQTIIILVKHFTGVQAVVSGQGIAASITTGSTNARSVSTGSGGGGGGGGCFIGTLVEHGEKRTEEKIPKSVSEILLAQIQKAFKTIAYWCKPIKQ
jgi:hypothetical protein